MHTHSTEDETLWYYLFTHFYTLKAFGSYFASSAQKQSLSEKFESNLESKSIKLNCTYIYIYVQATIKGSK